MSLRVAYLFSMLAVAAGARAESNEFHQPGKLQIDAGAERAATLHVGCSPDPDGGALIIEMTIPEANTRKDFDYDDFEGPDAVAGDKLLSHLVWSPAAGASIEITDRAAGWYASDPPEAYVFSVNQLSHRRQPPAKLLAAIGPDAGSLVWTQTGFDNATRKLIATFEFDAGASKRLHGTVAACLPPSSAKKPSG